MLKIKKLTLEDLEKSGEILGEVGDSLAGKAEVSIKDVVALITKKKLLRKFVGLIVVDEEGKPLNESDIANIGLIELVGVLNDFFDGEGSLLKLGLQDLMSSVAKKKA
jgi:hypothetical protein